MVLVWLDLIGGLMGYNARNDKIRDTGALSGVRRTSLSRRKMSANDPKRTSGVAFSSTTMPEPNS